MRRHLVGWTTLPGKVYDADGRVWGDTVLRFSFGPKAEHARA